MQLAISMSNSGGAWDNSKKYISAGGLGEEFRKGSEAHKNSVTGDTVGDPLKDTSGPALNIVMKLTAIISLVFGSVIAKYSNTSGGPVYFTEEGFDYLLIPPAAIGLAILIAMPYIGMIKAKIFGKEDTPEEQ